jgi:arylsulfatase
VIPDRRILRPGTSRLPVAAAPDLRGRSYRIDAELDQPLGDASGVLLACGDRHAGFTVFVRDRTLNHVYCHAGLSTATSARIDDGARRIGVAVVLGHRSATVELLADDVHVGCSSLRRPARDLLAYTGFDVGCDRGTPVGDYDAPYRFTGGLARVVVSAAPCGDVDVAGRLAVELATG